MPDVLIIADRWEHSSQSLLISPIAAEMKRAILADSTVGSPPPPGVLTSQERLRVEFCSGADLHPFQVEQWVHQGLRQVLPLTLNLPEWLSFPGFAIFKACADGDRVRHQVAEWGYITQMGTAWLPIVWTRKGPLYAEAIASMPSASEQPFSVSDRALAYRQPLHLTDSVRQPLYALGYRLLRSLKALPGVYLLRFGYDENSVWFDQLIPFPDWPAIASINLQTPDLFQCHWQCLNNQPIRDLSIIGTKQSLI